MTTNGDFDPGHLRAGIILAADIREFCSAARTMSVGANGEANAEEWLAWASPTQTR
jgi:hypothetical protein